MYLENNEVTLSGRVVGEFEVSHKVLGEKFLISKLEVRRLSGNVDVIPVVVSERLLTDESYNGKVVRVFGQFRSYNQYDGQKSHLILSVFAREISSNISCEEEENYIFLNGYICKEPVYRKTPLGREVADLLLAVNRPYGKSDYIPCISWGRNARYAAGLPVGTNLAISGRIQSREYIKRYSENEEEIKAVYEVSVCKMEVKNEERED